MVTDEIQHCLDYGRDELTCAASEVLHGRLPDPQTAEELRGTAGRAG